MAEKRGRPGRVAPVAQHAVVERAPYVRRTPRESKYSMTRPSPVSGAPCADRVRKLLVVVLRALDEEVAALQPLDSRCPSPTASTSGWVASVAQVPISASKASRAGSRSVMSVGPSHRAELIDSGYSQGRLAVLQAGTPTLLPIMPTIPDSLRPRLSRLAPATAPAAPASDRTRRRPEAFDQPRPRAVTRRRALPFPELGALLLLAGCSTCGRSTATAGPTTTTAPPCAR